MSAEYRAIELKVQSTVLQISVVVENRSRETWTAENFSLAWQFYDPKSGIFIEEGAWTPVPADAPPGGSGEFVIAIPCPVDSAGYDVYLSHLQPSGWSYARGEQFLRIGIQM